MDWQDKFPKEKLYYKIKNGLLYNGDVLEVLKSFPDKSIDMVVTSPPYWNLRNYEVEGQLGQEKDFNDYIEKLWIIFDEVYRVLKDTGIVFINLGDTYNNSKKGNTDNKNKKVNNVDIKKEIQKEIKRKSLLMIPERFAIGMLERGWILRNKIIWKKLNPVPTSAKDRFTNQYEYIYFFTKKEKYYFNQILEPFSKDILYRAFSNNEKDERKNIMYGRKKYLNKIKNGLIEGVNKKDVWEFATAQEEEMHFAVFPEKLPEICIEAGCPKKVCRECGVPYILEKEYIGKSSAEIVKELKIDKNRYNSEQHKKQNLSGLIKNRKIRVKSYKKQCNCDTNETRSGVVLDIFMGSGTTAVVAERLGCNWIGIELNREFCEMIKRKIKKNKVLWKLF